MIAWYLPHSSTAKLIELSNRLIGLDIERACLFSFAIIQVRHPEVSLSPGNFAEVHQGFVLVESIASDLSK